MGQDKSQESVQNILVMCVFHNSQIRLDPRKRKKEKRKKKTSGPPGDDVAKLGQHTVLLMQSKVHFI